MNQIVLKDSDFERLGRLGGGDLARIYNYLTERLRPHKTLEGPNDNVLSVRLPVDTVERVKQLALRFNTHRSRIVREAVIDFLRRNPI